MQWKAWFVYLSVCFVYFSILNDFGRFLRFDGSIYKRPDYLKHIKNTTRWEPYGREKISAVYENYSFAYLNDIFFRYLENMKSISYSFFFIRCDENLLKRTEQTEKRREQQILINKRRFVIGWPKLKWLLNDSFFIGKVFLWVASSVFSFGKTETRVNGSRIIGSRFV